MEPKVLWVLMMAMLPGVVDAGDLIWNVCKTFGNKPFDDGCSSACGAKSMFENFCTATELTPAECYTKCVRNSACPTAALRVSHFALLSSLSSPLAFNRQRVTVEYPSQTYVPFVSFGHRRTLSPRCMPPAPLPLLRALSPHRDATSAAHLLLPWLTHPTLRVHTAHRCCITLYHFLHEPTPQCEGGCDKYYVLKATNSYCDPGSWGDGTENTQADCKKCPAARYSAVTGLTSSSACTACGPAIVPGRFANVTGQTSESNACTGIACGAATIAGRYATATGQTSEAKACTGIGCPVARFGNSTGQTSEATACNEKCAAGRVGTFTGKSSEAEACEVLKCEAGEFAATVFFNSSNSSARISFNTTCESCATGRFGQSSKGTSTECTDCGLGKFAAKEKTTACMECPFNMVTGIEYTASECKFCEDGQVIDEDSGGKIICKTCANGEYRSTPTVNKPATCINCPSRGAQCAGGMLKLDDTTWYDFSSTKPLDESTNTYTCFNDESCMYDSSKSVLTCDVSKGYFGPLCGGCDRDNEQGHGFFTRSGRACAKCFESWLNWLAFVGIGLLVLSVLMYLVNLHSFAVARGEFAATVQKIAFSHLQMLGVLGIFKAKGTDVFNEVASRPAEVVGGSFTSLLPIKCALNSQYYGPFLITMLLPFLLLIVAALLMIPKVLIEKRMRNGRADKEPPVFKGRMNIPHCIAVYRPMRLPVNGADVTAWRGNFHAMERFSGVVVFIAFTLFPTLVASIASMFNCTEKIGGVPYLFADLTVKCYEGWHNWFIVFASIGMIVYAIGIPLYVGLVVAVRCPANEDAAKWTCRRCEMRSSEEYNTTSMRSRYAFLYNGYTTDRSRIVASWESIVMLRKLAVTLVGSMIKDPYLQIMFALLILVVSALATAYVEPYETAWLNLLDILGLFVLIITQILSIIYFYVAVAASPFADPDVIEVLVTTLLFIFNALVLLILFGFFVTETIGLREKLKERRSKVVKVASEDEMKAAAVAGIVVASQWWHHPSGTAVRLPPKLHKNLPGAAASTDLEEWMWRDTAHGNVMSDESPELLLIVDAGIDALETGDCYRLMDVKTQKLHELQTKLVDVGGRSCWPREASALDARQRAAGDAAAAIFLGASNPYVVGGDGDSSAGGGADARHGGANAEGANVNEADADDADAGRADAVAPGRTSQWLASAMKLTATLNPFGIAMQAMQRELVPEDSSGVAHGGDDDTVHHVPTGAFRRAHAVVNTVGVGEQSEGSPPEKGPVHEI